MKLCKQCKKCGECKKPYSELSNYAERCKEFEEIKQTNYDRIKALEWLKSKTKEYCEQCAYKNSEVCDICIFSKIEIALDLITRQQAEIERLKDSILAESEVVKAVTNELKTAKSEAVKEFAEKLREHKFEMEDIPKKEIFYAVETHHIDNLLKEMVGENNAEI